MSHQPGITSLPVSRMTLILHLHLTCQASCSLVTAKLGPRAGLVCISQPAYFGHHYPPILVKADEGRCLQQSEVGNGPSRIPANTQPVLGDQRNQPSQAQTYGLRKPDLGQRQDKSNTRLGSFQGRLATHPMYQLLLSHNALQTRKT